ncbi:MAG: hypothetical protein Q8S53_09410 [Brevundimonas sp.]|uniref:hypothetical protein n=1 Tax=Brevundimonas sp. TaxID=1871086 RepID=UPI002732F12F|nr:hypothetical protein [Brevundimonas sp.]MDP3378571.1 hypothetical protein [Brevundimonas sp.]
MRALRSGSWVVVGLLAVGLALVAAHGLGLRWDPFDLQGRRLEAARSRVALAEADAHARRAERDGDHAVSREVTAARDTEIEVGRVTATAIQQARDADDADTPLAPDRVRRLDDHDRELCRHAPALCAGAGKAESAG